jgi:hypothetical protein
VQLSMLSLKTGAELLGGHNFRGGLLFITAVPNTKLCAWGEEDCGGHVL